MKTPHFILILLATVMLGAKKADIKNVFAYESMVWYGLDFTHAKFVGGFNQAGGIGEVSGYDLVHKWIPAWNDLILYEQAKFDLKRAFVKKDVYYDVKNINLLNAEINPDSCMTPNPETLSAEKIAGMVKKYKGDKKEGLGLSFIIENFNKANISSDIYIVFFDIATGKVLLSEKVIGKPVGIGLRNYWAGAVNHCLVQIRKTEYNRWKKKYN